MHFTLPYSAAHLMIIHAVGQMIDAGLFVYLVNHFFFPLKPENTQRTQSLIAGTVGFLLLFLGDCLSGANYYIYYLLLILIPFVYSLFFFREKILIKLVISLIFTLLVMTFEYVAINVTRLLGYSATSAGLIPLLLFLLRRIGNKILLFFLLKHLLFWTREHDIALPDSCWILLLILTVWDNILFFCHIPDTEEIIPEKLFLAFFLIFVPIFLLMIIKYLSIASERNRVISAQVSQEKIQNQYLRQQLDMSDSLRKFRHDYKAHLFCMDTLLEAGKYEELHQYLFELHQYQYDGIHLRRFVDDESLNILLNQKATVAEKYGIRFTADISLPSNGKIAISDLNSLITNLCDNAIEACATLPDAGISISVRKVKAYLIITIVNSCYGDVCRDNPDFRTHKSNPGSHGLGLKIVKSIVEKYHGEYKVSSTDGTFSTSILLLDD